MANRFSSTVKTTGGGSGPRTVAFAQALKSFKRVSDQGTRAHKAAIDAIHQAVFDQSQYYCPVDTGDLKEGAYVSSEKGEDRYRRATVTTYTSYIVYPEPYAIFVHECVGHFHDPPTSAKFISRVVSEMWSELNQIGGEAYQRSFYFEQAGV